MVHGSLLVQAVSEDGEGVSEADVMVDVRSPWTDAVIGTYVGATNAAGEYRRSHLTKSPPEAWFPADVTVVPPSEAQLARTAVRDSICFEEDYPPQTTVIEVHLEGNE